MKILLMAALGSLLALNAGATTIINGGMLSSFGSTPVALSTVMPLPIVSTKVNQVKVSMVPGYGCKVFVGGLFQNFTTLTGVYKAMYPNIAGGWSEEWSLVDPRATDGIDLANIAVSADTSGGCASAVTISYLQTGSSTASLLRNYLSGPLYYTNGVGTKLDSTSVNTATVLQIHVIPGLSGKIMPLSAQLTTLKILFPNSGDPAQSSARSEGYVVSYYGAFELIRPYQMYIKADVLGEGGLVSAWTIN